MSDKGCGSDRLLSLRRLPPLPMPSPSTLNFMSLMSPYLSNTLCISSLVTHNGNHNTLHRRISLSHAYMCSVTFRFGGLKLLPFQLSTTVESLKVINHWSPRSICQAASTPSSMTKSTKASTPSSLTKSTTASTPSSLTKSTTASTPSSLTKSVPVHRC